MLEGISFILLMGVGVPLKYIMGETLGVRIAGPLHGLLFTWLVLLIASAVFSEGWSVKRGGAVFVACLLPFGPFLIDKKLAAWQAEFDKS